MPIIALLGNKINPQFEKNPNRVGKMLIAVPTGAGKSLRAIDNRIYRVRCDEQPGRRSCQEGNFCTKKQLSSKYTRGKKWKSGDFSALCLCQPECIFTMHAPLWKSAVDKPVENVENSGLSTGIPVGTHGGQGCGKVCISQCIICPVLPKSPGYVTVFLPLPGKKSGLKVTKL